MKAYIITALLTSVLALTALAAPTTSKPNAEIENLYVAKTLTLLACVIAL